MSAADLNTFCQNLSRSKLLTEADITAMRTQARAESGAAALPEGFANWLVEKGKLTRYQADSVLRGNVRFFLDDYTLRDRIGTGRMAGVYEATHKLGMRVAVKILPPSRAKQGEALARFQREAQLALQLDHPHVVKTYHAGDSEGLNYIAMEYLEGETLEERLASKGKLPPMEAVKIVYQALQALQHVHEKSIVHRDVKPGNLFLVTIPSAPGDDGPSYSVKLLDIGLGRALFDEEGTPNADLTADGALIGTPDYMSPEQGRNSHAADIRSDIYGLGCVLYHCLTGQPPFPDKNAVVKLTKHAKEMPPLPNLGTYPQATQLLRVLWKMIAKDPAMRYPTPAEAALALEPFLAVQVAPPIAAPVAQPVKPAASPKLGIAAPVKAPAMIDVEPVEMPDPNAAKNLRQILFGVAALLIVVIVVIAVVLLLRKKDDADSHLRERELPARCAGVEVKDSTSRFVLGNRVHPRPMM